MSPKVDELGTEEDPANALNSHASAPFMRLPPELRNRIYEHAVRLEDGICEVSEAAGIPEPALLLTCKEVRREAIGIFYSVNTVRLMVVSYSPAMPTFIFRKQAAVRAQYDCEITTAVRIFELGPPRWRNLLSWLRLCHLSSHSFIVPIMNVRPLRTEGQPCDTPWEHRETMVVAGMFQMVEAMREVCWGDIEVILAMLRYGLVQLDSEWGVD